MEKLYHSSLSGKNILFSVNIRDPHYFSLEFHFPFSGLKADYYNENTDLRENMEISLESFTDNIYTILKTVHQKFRDISEIERSQILQIGSASEKILNILETECIEYIMPYWSRTLLESLSSKLVTYLAEKDEKLLKYSELDYPNIYKELIYRFGECKSIGHGQPIVQKVYWFRKFEADANYAGISLKKLKGQNYTMSLPDSVADSVPYDLFVKEEADRLPFIIGTQLGTTPKITPELKRQLEGQKIALLRKSQLSGRETMLEICEVKNGKFLTVQEFINDPSSLNVHSMPTSNTTTPRIFSPENIVYKLVSNDKTYYVTKEDHIEANGMIVTMMRPYRDVQWDFFSSHIECEPEKQMVLRDIIITMEKLYLMLEVNMHRWKRGLSKFRLAHKELAPEFALNLYIEMMFGGIVDNPTIFPPDITGSWAKAYYKTVLREVIESGNFRFSTGALPLSAIDHTLKVNRTVVIDITPYNEEERNLAFAEISEENKINLYSAMQRGYGSQFDQLVTNWIKNSDK